MFDDPELVARVKKHAYGLAGSGCDFVITGVKLNNVAKVGIARGAKR
jgi:hypothetical protein